MTNEKSLSERLRDLFEDVRCDPEDYRPLVTEVESLQHDVSRSMANHAADINAVEPSDESDPCVSHLAMKEYERALQWIRDYPLHQPGIKDSQIWADMLETAREALDGSAENRGGDA